MALVFGLGSILFGLFVSHFNQKKMLLASCLLMIVGFMCIAYIASINSTNPLLITLAFIPFVISQIITTTILYPICLNFMPHAKGRVSGMIQGIRLIFTAFSLQLAGYFYLGSFQNIGIIILSFIFTGIITMFLILFTENINKRLHA